MLLVPPTGWGSRQFDFSFLDDDVNTTNGTGFTFSSFNLGPAHSTRHIIVAAGGTRSDTAATTITDISVQGISGTEVVTNGDPSDDTSMRASIWIVPVPTGTTGDIIVTFAASSNQCAIAVWSMINPVSSTATGTASDITVSSNAFSASLTIPAGGAGVGFVIAAGNPSARTWSWTNLTERADALAESLTTYSAADSLTAGSATRTATASGTLHDQFVGHVLVLAAWN